MYPLLPFSLNQPLAVDNAISTIGVIHKIIAKMNEVIEEVNNIDSKANEYTDEQIRLLKIELQSKFDDIENEIVLLNGRVDLTNSNLTTLENAFNDFKIAITTSVNQLTINVANLSDYVAQTESMLISYIDNKIDILTHLIETLKGVKVFGVNGKLTTVQNAIDDCIKLSRINRYDITIKAIKYLMNQTYTYNNVTHNMNDLTFGVLKNIYGINSNTTQINIDGYNYALIGKIYNTFKEILYKPYVIFTYYFCFGLATQHNAGSATPSHLQTMKTIFTTVIGSTNSVDINNNNNNAF